jgi:MYXO-CTERM domain-containing protein
MRNYLAPIFASALVTAVSMSFTAPAQARTIDACGNIEFRAEAKCEMVVSGGCTAQCTPVNFQAQCSADLYLGCEGQCTANLSASCSASCQADCSAQCKVDPGSLECSAYCRADCEANCDGACSGSADGARCRASCKATCGGECDAGCTGTAPSATCDAKCKASCKGSCEAEANVDCQVDCQAKGFLECEAQLTGGCQTQCTKPEGALFCDGQYVDAREQLDQCVNQLKSLLNIEVEGYAYGDAQCRGGECTAEGEAGVSCSASGGEGSDTGTVFGIFGAVAAFGLAVGRKRRRS